MDKHLAQWQAKVQRQTSRNTARLHCCAVHEFDWKGAMQRARARRKALEEETGVIVGAREVVWCRCKYCGGKVPTYYAGPYMEGVTAARAAMTTEVRNSRKPRPP